MVAQGMDEGCDSFLDSIPTISYQFATPCLSGSSSIAWLDLHIRFVSIKTTHTFMKPIQVFATTAFAVALTSCAANKAESYDTPGVNPPADASNVNAPVNPVYDTPAAYEVNSATEPSPQTSPNLPAPSMPGAAASNPAPASNGAAIIHTVVAGDTLSGISAKYKVPSAVIKQANGMTKDTVVLGKKMVIPPQ